MPLIPAATTAPGEPPDGDGLTNMEEYHFGTDPLNADTAGDGLPDAWEDSNGARSRGSFGCRGICRRRRLVEPRGT